MTTKIYLDNELMGPCRGLAGTRCWVFCTTRFFFLFFFFPPAMLWAGCRKDVGSMNETISFPSSPVLLPKLYFFLPTEPVSLERWVEGCDRVLRGWDGTGSGTGRVRTLKTALWMQPHARGGCRTTDELMCGFFRTRMNQVGG